MDYLWPAYTEPLGSNLFQKVYDFSGPLPPPIDGRFRILPNGTYRSIFITLAEEVFRVVDVTP